MYVCQLCQNQVPHINTGLGGDFLKIGTPFRQIQSNVPVKEIPVTVSAISKGIYYVSLKNIQGYSSDLKPYKT